MKLRAIFLSLVVAIVLAAASPDPAYAAGDGHGPLGECYERASGDAQAFIDCLTPETANIENAYGLPSGWVERLIGFVRSNPNWQGTVRGIIDRLEDLLDRLEDIQDRAEDRRDRKEDLADRREDFRDRYEDRHDDELDREDIYDRLEDLRDAREDIWDRREDRTDRRENWRDRWEDIRDQRWP